MYSIVYRVLTPKSGVHSQRAGVASPLTASGGVVDRSATWNFSYSNSAPLAAGNYNGRVFYTAALP